MNNPKEFSDADSAVEHLRRVSTLADSLKKLNLAIYEHHWDSLCFGSWTITAGKRHDCYEFSWDGREFFINVSHSNNLMSGRPVTWVPVENHRLPPTEGKDPVTFVQEFFQKK